MCIDKSLQASKSPLTGGILYFEILNHLCSVWNPDFLQVYSPEAKAENFHHSLLERLFEYSSSNNCHRHIILSDNYRSCKEILKFLSGVSLSESPVMTYYNQNGHKNIMLLFKLWSTILNF